MSELLRFESFCRKNGVVFSHVQLGKLESYVKYLLDWNSKINLISRNDISNVWFSHILHSLSILFFVKVDHGAHVLDLGTGGGLPGIPLSIAREDLRFMLVDSIRKKMMTVEDMIARIDIPNVGFATGRAEDLNQKKEFSKQYDLVVSRAVAPLNDLIRWSRPFLKDSSLGLVTLKGGDLNDEVREAKIKSKPKDISVTPLVFVGSEELGFEGKKIVVVTM